jgi:hypothetical protein
MNSLTLFISWSAVLIAQISEAEGTKQIASHVILIYRLLITLTVQNEENRTICPLYNLNL